MEPRVYSLPACQDTGFATVHSDAAEAWQGKGTGLLKGFGFSRLLGTTGH
jgi:hypothetical protein